jgi:hypothetical protein
MEARQEKNGDIEDRWGMIWREARNGHMEERKGMISREGKIS